MLLGKDVVLRDRSLDLAHSIRRILQSSPDNLLSTLRILLNMVRCCMLWVLCMLI